MNRKRNKRNIHFGFLPAQPTRADLVKSRREFKAGVREKVREMRAEYARLRRSARAGRTASTRKLEQLFHEVYGPEGPLQNPRTLPGMSAKQLAAIERLIRGTTIMAKKRKSKKKKNARKGKMPAGLKAYWAKKRAAKAKRRNPRRKRAHRPRRRRVSVRVRNFRRTPRVRRAHRPRRRRANPIHTARRITLKGFTAAQIRKVASVVRRATGKRVRVVRP